MVNRLICALLTFAGDVLIDLGRLVAISGMLLMYVGTMLSKLLVAKE